MLFEHVYVAENHEIHNPLMSFLTYKNNFNKIVFIYQINEDSISLTNFE